MKAWGFKELGSWRQEAGEAWRARERPGPVQRALAEDRETGSGHGRSETADKSSGERRLQRQCLYLPTLIYQCVKCIRMSQIM